MSLNSFVERLEAEVASIKVAINKIETKGVKKAVTDGRNAAQEIKKIAQELRTALTAKKEELNAK